MNLDQYKKQYDSVKNDERDFDEILEKLKVDNPLLIADLDRDEV